MLALGIGSSGCGRRLPTEDSSSAELRQVASEILATFGVADLVCLGEDHGSTLDADLRSALIGHPEFVETVDVVVIEFGNPVHQELLDRVVLEGEDSSREELRSVWRDAGRGVVWELPMYERLIREIAAANRVHPRSNRVRVVGAAVPFDWSEIETTEDLEGWPARSSHFAATVQRQVFEADAKGLAVFGVGHCERRGMGFVTDLEPREQQRVLSMFGFEIPGGRRAAEDLFGIDSSPRLLQVVGTEHARESTGSLLFEGHRYAGATLGEVVDYLVDYGKLEGQVLTVDEDRLDAEFRAEVARRDRLRAAALSQ